MGFRYQFTDNRGFSTFNNSELFDVDTQKKTIAWQKSVTAAKLEGRAAIYNSIITLRNSLPLAIKDVSVEKSVSDTVIGNRDYYVLKLVMRDKFPNYLGTGYSNTTKELTFYQRVIVDKGSLLPVAMLQTKKGSEDLNRTDFTNLKINPAPPAEKSWYYSTYTEAYTPEVREQFSIIEVGAAAPEFSLTNHLKGEEERLSKYKGRMVLLEFWIKNCGYCIEAVPKLNALSKQYKPADLALFAINTEDTDQAIDSFIKSHQVQYSVLKDGKSTVSKDYGIDAFPQVVLIDKAGQVIYSGGLDVAKITALIDKNL